MKRTWKIVTDFLCAAMFFLNACMHGVVLGLMRGRGYYVALGAVWLAGSAIWALRGIRALKHNNNE